MDKGDRVTITDGSYAVKLSAADWDNAFINKPSRRGEEFTVIGLRDDGLVTKYSGSVVHDIIIRSDTTGEIYLHSSSFVQVIERAKCPCCGKEV